VPSIRKRLALLAVLAVPGAARAQSTTSLDSLPFRSGQWGTEFIAGSQFGGVGVMRFHSARAAWTIDVGGSANRQNAGGSFGSSGSGSNLGVRLGHRWYRPVARSVGVYLGTGVNGAVGRSSSQHQAADKVRQSLRSVGAYGELGGAYFVSPHLSLGGGVALNASTYRQSEQRTDAANVRVRTSSSGYGASVGTSQLFATLYF
jgi:hypothetical protein